MYYNTNKTWRAYLKEARRQDREGIPREASMIDRLKQLAQGDYNPDTGRPLPADHFISFTSINKIGINPGSEYNTPNGIYTYPLRSELVDQLENAKVPFASESDYVQLVKTNSDTRLLDPSASNIDWNTLIRVLFSIQAVTRLGLDESNTLAKEVKQFEDYFASNPDDGPDLSDPKQRFLHIIRNSASIKTALDNPVPKNRGKWPMTNIWNLTRILSDENPKLWANMLRYAGYDGAYDTGLGIIHKAEPMQAVFFHRGAIELVDSFENTHKPDIVVKRSTNDISALSAKLASFFINNPKHFGEAHGTAVYKKFRRRFGSQLKQLFFKDIVPSIAGPNKSRKIGSYGGINRFQWPHHGEASAKDPDQVGDLMQDTLRILTIPETPEEKKLAKKFWGQSTLWISLAKQLANVLDDDIISRAGKLIQSAGVSDSFIKNLTPNSNWAKFVERLSKTPDGWIDPLVLGGGWSWDQPTKDKLDQLVDIHKKLTASKNSIIDSIQSASIPHDDVDIAQFGDHIGNMIMKFESDITNLE